MCTSSGLGRRDGANVSIAGCNIRSGASSWAARLVVLEDGAVDDDEGQRPLRNGGSSGMGGKLMMRSDVVTESGASLVHCAHARNHPGGPLAVPQQHAGVGRRGTPPGRARSPTTTPKLPPPPRIAQKRSVLVVASARTRGAVGGHDLHGAPSELVSDTVGCARRTDNPPESA